MGVETHRERHNRLGERSCPITAVAPQNCCASAGAMARTADPAHASGVITIGQLAPPLEVWPAR